MIHATRTPEGWRATAEVVVGIDPRTIEVDLGPLAREPDPGGLWSAPVVTASPAAATIVRAGALRAGRSPAVLVLPADGPYLAGQLLVAVAEGSEILMVENGDVTALTAARALGGHPIPSLPLDDPEALAALLSGLTVDVTLALPDGREDQRRQVRDVLAPHDPATFHHLVDVDPRPAFDELGWDPAGASLSDLAAAAAGVLAGRIAHGNRRWRA